VNFTSKIHQTPILQQIRTNAFFWHGFPTFLAKKREDIMKHLFVLAVLFIGANALMAQTNDRKWNLGVHAGFKEYAGDLGNDFLQFNPVNFRNTISLGFTINRYLNKSFDFTGMGNYVLMLMTKVCLNQT
jgi:hypothetical protein